MRCVVAFTFSAAMIWVVPTGAVASPSAKLCDQTIVAPFSAKLASCDALVDSGEFSGQNLADVYLMRGRIHFFNGHDRTRAFADFDRALMLSPRYAAVYYFRSLIHKVEGDKERQIADLSEAIKINQDEVELYSERGMAYVLQGEIDLARADFEQVMKLDPDAGLARTVLGLHARGGAGTGIPLRKADPYVPDLPKPLTRP
jgi:tetratricopeptide (TPR) repeat protein